MGRNPHGRRKANDVIGSNLLIRHLVKQGEFWFIGKLAKEAGGKYSYSSCNLHARKQAGILYSSTGESKLMSD